MQEKKNIEKLAEDKWLSFRAYIGYKKENFSINLRALSSKFELTKQECIGLLEYWETLGYVERTGKHKWTPTLKAFNKDPQRPF